MMRLFLIEREHPPLLEMMKPKHDVMPRGEYLTSVLGGEADIRFSHRRDQFAYHFFQTIEKRYIVGAIGRERSQIIGRPPEEGFKHHAVPDWETANFLLDMSGPSDGQKVAMQNVADIGVPLPILRSLVDDINEREPDSDWMIAANPISSQEEFWTVADRRRGRISEIDLRFVPPNIWGGASETEKALRELHEQNNATEVEVRIINREKKLHPDSKRIRESVDYIAKGAGSAKIKEGGRTVFDSDKKVETVSVEDDVSVQDADQSTILKLIRRIFGR